MPAAQGYIGRNPADSATVIARQSFSPTGIQTDFTFAAGYEVGYVDLYLNGARLIEGQDFTATDGSTVGLTTNAVNGDVLEVVGFKAFNVANVTNAGGSFTVAQNLTVGGTAEVTGAITATGGVVGDVTGNATGLSGTPDLTIRNLTGVAATFTGVLSYADVTNVDSVGFATFRKGINVQGAGSTTTTLNVSGVTTMTGDVNIAAAFNIPDAITHAGDTNTKIRFPANDTFTVETDGSEAFRITGDQRIGIGTDDPLRQLEVYNSTNAIINLKSDTQSSVIFSDPADTNIGMLIYEHSSDSMQFRVNDAERARIDSSGRLLLGTTSNVGSSSILQVREDGFGRNLEIFRSYDSNNTPARIRLSNSRGTAASPTIVVDDDDLGEIRFNGHDGTNYDTPAAAIFGVVDGTPGENDMPGRLEFHTTSDGGSSTTERLRITSDGNVRVPDNGKFTCGAGDDLKIYHNGSVNYLAGDEIRLVNNAVSETMAKFIHDGAVELYHNDIKRLETTSGGISVAGEIVASGSIDLTDSTVDLYSQTTNGASKTFQLFSDIGGTKTEKVFIEASGDASFAGTVSDSKGDLRKIIYKQEGSAYTLVAADAGKAIEAQGNVTVPNSVFAAGDAITIINDSGSNISILKGSGLGSMFNVANGGNADLTLAGRGMATIYFVNSTTCYVSGGGLS